MSILDRLRPKIPQETIENSEEIKAKYRYWRTRIFYSIYIGYAMFYFTRKSFTFSMPALMTDLGFDKTDLGFLGTLLAVTYAISKFLSGVISDKSSLRVLMGAGLVLTGILNLCVGFSSSILLFGIFLGLNGFFQGWGSPPCAKLLTYWYSQTERGRWWGIWNTSHNIGGAVIPILCAFAIQAFGWRYAMYLPGVMAIVIGLFLINRIRNTPKQVDLPTIEKYRNDYPEDKGKETIEEEKNFSPREILVERILKNKFIWVLAISYFFVYIVRIAIYDWVQLYLMEEKGYSLMIAGSCVFWFEIGGIFGSLAAGSLSDTVFHGRRGPINILFTVGVVANLLFLWFIPSVSLVTISIAIFIFGFLIFGPQMLIGMAAAELVDKEAAGTATGFAGLFAYAGAACAGWPIGWVIEKFGWSSFFLLLSVCASIALLLLLPLWSKGTRLKLAAQSN
ncbi:MAG: phosphoglycerate transporter protein PgtP [Candidatus Neptunochlamydia sp.]|nr:phosphoglycerate transporter protein PgtP [Candidatus Neptunochlamydia sp.]